MNHDADCLARPLCPWAECGLRADLSWFRSSYLTFSSHSGWLSWSGFYTYYFISMDVRMHGPCMCKYHGGQRIRCPGTEVIGGCEPPAVGSENRTRSSARAESALSCWTLSQVPVCSCVLCPCSPPLPVNVFLLNWVFCATSRMLSTSREDQNKLLRPFISSLPHFSLKTPHGICLP